jgi:hypothetical protein
VHVLLHAAQPAPMATDASNDIDMDSPLPDLSPVDLEHQLEAVLEAEASSDREFLATVPQRGEEELTLADSSLCGFCEEQRSALATAIAANTDGMLAAVRHYSGKGKMFETPDILQKFVLWMQQPAAVGRGRVNLPPALAPALPARGRRVAANFTVTAGSQGPILVPARADFENVRVAKLSQ